VLKSPFPVPATGCTLSLTVGLGIRPYTNPFSVYGGSPISDTVPFRTADIVATLISVTVPAVRTGNTADNINETSSELYITFPFTVLT